ncbi:translation initiation factor IF-6 [Candidatus Woesearchaeota archaeon]|nr:translation initiation factor IF-6 [Candidatus Woesearchaeota archaeon]
MHLKRTSFNGNPNVGLYGVATDDMLLIGKEVPEDKDGMLEEVLGLPVKRVSIAGTGLLGVFCLWHDGKLLVPGITFDHELEDLEALGVAYEVIDTDLTCLGNNVLVGLKSALAHPDFTDAELSRLSDALGLPVERATIMEVESVGAVGVTKAEKGLFHRDIPPEAIKDLESQLGLDITQGTVNMGNPYVKSGVLVTNHGFIIGDASGGPEVRNADEALGFIGDGS